MTNEFVKLQPQATELEELVLGAMMLEKDAVMTVLSILKAEMFYNGNYQHIYRSIEKLFYSGHPVDISTVANQLKSNGLLESVGGVHEVAQLTNRVGSAANVDYHSRIIYQKWLSREMIRISNLTIKDCYEDTTDILKLIEETAKQILFLSDILFTLNVGNSDIYIRWVLFLIIFSVTNRGIKGLSCHRLNEPIKITENQLCS